MSFKIVDCLLLFGVFFVLAGIFGVFKINSFIGMFYVLLLLGVGSLIITISLVIDSQFETSKKVKGK